MTVSIAEASGVINEINVDIASVDASAGEISDKSTQVSGNAEELKQMATKLNEIIGRFKFSYLLLGFDSRAVFGRKIKKLFWFCFVLVGITACR
ncbi:MAG: hypothetical protein JEZ12_11310 [Desulfobacterium sp.]|nr:hypothetical protein [Desulfobacterium sp.]